MQALPYATQLLARLGADVVKVESTRRAATPGAASLPAMDDPEGRQVGATFLRNNLDKRSICVDLKDPAGRAADPRPGAALRRRRRELQGRRARPPGPRLRRHRRRTPGDLRVDLGVRQHHPVALRPLAGVRGDRRGDVGHLRATSGSATSRPWSTRWAASATSASALFAVDRDPRRAAPSRRAPGEGQHVDVAMLDAMVAMTDIVTNFWSMGLRDGDLGPLILRRLRGRGRLVHHPGRPRAPVRQAGRADRPSRVGRRPALRHPPGLGRPPRRRPPPGHRGVGGRQGARSRCATRSPPSGVAAGPCFRDEDDRQRPARRRPQHARRDAAHRRRSSSRSSCPATRSRCRTSPRAPRPGAPWLGEHTDEVLAAELGLDAERLAALRDDGAIA